jgi:hypothetical protein
LLNPGKAFGSEALGFAPRVVDGKEHHAGSIDFSDIVGGDSSPFLCSRADEALGDEAKDGDGL